MTPRGFSPATTAVFTRAARPAIVTLCLVAAVLAPSPLRAQSATNTSAIEGRVVDESGAALPGVTVTIASPALQTPQLDAQSDEGGRYRFTALPRGIYTLTFTLSGFQKITRTDVNIDAGFSGGHVAGLIARRAGLARLSAGAARAAPKHPGALPSSSAPGTKTTAENE